MFLCISLSIYIDMIFYCVLTQTLSFISPPAQAFHLVSVLASLAAQMVKNPPAVWETWVQSLDWEDPLDESMAAHSSILAWRTPWKEKPGGLQSMGSQRVGHD